MSISRACSTGAQFFCKGLTYSGDKWKYTSYFLKSTSKDYIHIIRLSFSVGIGPSIFSSWSYNCLLNQSLQIRQHIFLFLLVSAHILAGPVKLLAFHQGVCFPADYFDFLKIILPQENNGTGCLLWYILLFHITKDKLIPLGNTTCYTRKLILSIQ